MTARLAGKRIGLLTASASRLGGGVFEAVVNQARLIGSLGGEPLIFALEDAHSGTDAPRFGNARLSFSAVRGPRQIGFAPDLLSRLLAAELDILHLHGIWMYPSRAGLAWARATGGRYIVSPHGMLDSWITARGQWKKALARAGYERASWRAAWAMHALTASEADDIRRESGRADSLVIPNPAPPLSPALPADRRLQVLYIGRIHPKKNLLALVEGWRQAGLPAAAELVIAGWGDSVDVAALEAAVAAAGPQVRFVGPVYDGQKQALLEQSRFTILPSFGEGLPMAVLEGWSAGAPAILSANCNLPEGFAAGAAIECGHSPQAIAAALETALCVEAGRWQAMSRAALDLASGPFGADRVAAQWAAAYLGEAD
jgi:poly(glycerol-phosphate) alpha-glucosyltransferase